MRRKIMRRICAEIVICCGLSIAAPASAAWTHINTEGIAEKTSDSSLELNPVTNPAADSIVVVVCSTDNPDNTGPGEKTFHAISDNQGSSWTRLMEYQAAGNGGASVITSVWASKLTAAITGNIICTLLSNRSAKVLIMSEYTVAASKTFSKAGVGRTSGTGTSPSILLSGLPSAAYNWLGVVGVEGPGSDGFTEDTPDYTQRNRTGSSGGGAAGNQTANSANRLLTATSDTYNPVLGSGRDFVIILVALEEVDEAADDPVMVIQ